MSTSPYQAALIGLGQIAAGYGTPEQNAPYCHAGGLLKSPRFDLAAAAEPFETARQNFQEKWGAALPQAELFDDMEAMLDSQRFDAVAVCVRGPHHQTIMRRVLEAKPRVIFLEKPPTTSLTDMDELLELSRQHEVPIMVSYSRHWSPRVLQMQQLVREGLIGEVQTVVAYCGKLVLSFASHTTDLICQFACAQNESYDPIAVTARGFIADKTREGLPDDFAARGFEAEPSLTNLHIEFAGGARGFQVGARSDHGSFYADVFGTRGRVRVGIYTQSCAFDESGEPMELPPMPHDDGPFARAYEQVADYLDGGKLPDCTGAQFAAVNEIGFGAIESLLQDGQRITLPNAKRQRMIYANG